VDDSISPPLTRAPAVEEGQAVAGGDIDVSGVTRTLVIRTTADGSALKREAAGTDLHRPGITGRIGGGIDICAVMDREGSRNGHLYAASLSGGDSIGCDDTVVGEQHIIRCGDVEITAFSCSVLCSTSYPGQSSAARIDPDVSGTNGNLSAH